jgi:hypothetical protein
LRRRPNPPAVGVVQIAALARRDFLIQIEGMAVLHR